MTIQAPDETRWPFIDPIRQVGVTLVVDRTKRLFDALTVEHPGCDVPADVSADLDAFYCRTCHWNGRIDGMWAIELWDAAQ